MEKEFPHDNTVPRQVSLEIAYVFETLFPNLFADQSWRQFLLRQKFGMHPDDEHLFIITTIKDSDLTTIRQALHASPEIIVVQVLARGRFEGIHLATLWISPLHDVLDGAVFAGRVHRLKDQQHRPLVLRVELVL